MSQPRILIVGAGSMGMVTGLNLSLAGAEVTFLIRPHRAEALNRPQLLYSFNDHKLKEFKNYNYIIDPSQMTGKDYDYIIVTLDGASLKNETGQSLVATIGSAVRQSTKTKVILGTVFFNIRPWFLEVSGLDESQVVLGWITIHAYPTAAVTLPLHSPTDPELLSKASTAYIDSLGDGFCVSDSNPNVANGFAKIYNASGVSKCGVMPQSQAGLFMNPIFTVFIASEVLDWPPYKDIDPQSEIWGLAVAAWKEIQALSIHGEPGQEAAKSTTESTVATMFASMETLMQPLDLAAFYKYHHGGKVVTQDREHLYACLAYGEAEGKPMMALKELLGRVDK